MSIKNASAPQRVQLLLVLLIGIALIGFFSDRVTAKNLVNSAALTFVATSTPTPSASALRIHDIQGSGHLSPYLAKRVSDIPGIVTAKRSNGFYIQDPQPDENEATSEGIFVFTRTDPPPVNVGDAVFVSGTVSEFRPGFSTTPPNCTVDTNNTGECSSLNRHDLSVTEIVVTDPADVQPWRCLTQCSITPITLGKGGRPLPQTLNVEAANIEIGGTLEDTVNFYESLEGMRVRLNSGARTVSPSSSFSSGYEVWVVPDDYAESNGSVNSRGGVTLQASDFNMERIRVTTKSGGKNPLPTPYPSAFNVNVGSQFTTELQGIIDYSFTTYELILTSSNYALVPSKLAKEVTALASSATQFTIATYNVENLDPNDTTFRAHAARIVNNLLAPDIVILEEIQDNNGVNDGGTVDANTTFDILIRRMFPLGVRDYAYAQIDPVYNMDGGAPGGNIRVAFLYRTSRVTFDPDNLPDGDATTKTTLACQASGPLPNLVPGRINPASTAWKDSRKPLVGVFTFNADPLQRRFYVIGNHFNSKGGDDPMYGNTLPPVLQSEPQRIQQSNEVRTFVQSIYDCDPNANVIVAGDLNDFQWSPALRILADTPLQIMNLTITNPLDRYGYIYQGNSQTLDHILVSPNLMAEWSPEYDAVHYNAEFYDQLSDHDPSVLRLTIPSATPMPPTIVPTDTPTAASATEISTPTLTATVTPTASPSETTATSIATGTPTEAPTSTATETVTDLPSITPTETAITVPIEATPTATPTAAS